MKQYLNVLGSQEVVKPIEVNVDTVYIRTNIKPYKDEFFEGWQYDETQYTYKEYMELLAKQEELNRLEERLLTPIEVYANLDKSGILLEDLKRYKLAELDEYCTRAITKGFEYNINKVNYLFSASLEAQGNFQGTDTLFKEGIIEEVYWSVTNIKTGIVERIPLNKETFNQIKLTLFNHVNAQISKFRDTLQPQVLSATTVEEVDSVVW